MIFFFKKIVGSLLFWLARLTLRKYHPLVVGVTGSVGKSSTKEAVALVLSKNYAVRKSEGNYNNEFGLPLTILGRKSPGKNIFGWTEIILSSLFFLLWRRQYPETLVLEMGVDKPEDMNYLLRCAVPNIGVVTQISESHLESFGTLGNIAKEKGRLMTVLPEDGFAILNADDERVVKMAERTKAKVLTYGFSESASVKASNVILLQEGNHVEGISFKLSFEGTTIPVRLPEMIGKHLLSSILAAAAVGIAQKMNLVDIAEALVSFRPLPGRLTLLLGKNGMRLVDDTYNASFISTKAALSVLKEIIAPRRVVILGDMLEIGETSMDIHRELANPVIASGANVFVGVGKHMCFLADALRNTPFPQKNIYTFRDPVVAVQALRGILRPGDLILVKGSRSMRMEKIVEAFLDDSLDPKETLCCQSPSWRKKPFTPPVEWKE